MRHRPAVALAAAALLLAATAHADAASLTVDVIGADPAVGQLLVAVYGSEAAYLTAPAAARTAPVLAIGFARIVFRDLPPGDYAVTVVHDADDDGKLNRTGAGIPAERVGFSNNARSRSGPPGWRFVRFTVSEDTRILVALDDPGG